MLMCTLTDLLYGGRGLKMFSMARPKKWRVVLSQQVSRTSRVHYLMLSCFPQEAQQCFHGSTLLFPLLSGSYLEERESFSLLSGSC